MAVSADPGRSNSAVCHLGLTGDRGGLLEQRVAEPLREHRAVHRFADEVAREATGLIAHPDVRGGQELVGDGQELPHPGLGRAQERGDRAAHTERPQRQAEVLHVG